MYINQPHVALVKTLLEEIIWWKHFNFFYDTFRVRQRSLVHHNEKDLKNIKCANYSMVAFRTTLKHCVCTVQPEHTWTVEDSVTKVESAKYKDA